MCNGDLAAKKSILIVDNDGDIRLILKVIFTCAGYSVTEACSGQEALELLESAHFDLMVLDLLMPQVSGEQVLQQLGKERLKEIPVIILTAKSPQRNVRKERGENPLFYVVKPFRNAAIRDLARYFLEDLTEEEKEKMIFDLCKYPCFAINFGPYNLADST